MKRQAEFLFVILGFSLLVSCAGLTTTSISQAKPNTLMQPGELLGKMKLVRATTETGEPSVFDTCTPIIADSDPSVIVRKCNVPKVPYLFLGYGEYAESPEKLNSIWNNESWAMYLDGKAVDLSAFGSSDVEWNGNKLRQWNVAVEDIPFGEHRLRYIITFLDMSKEPLDVTWIFSVQQIAAIR